MYDLVISMSEIGLNVSEPILDGNIHRVKAIGKRSKDCWYVGKVINDRVYCKYGNWSTGQSGSHTNGEKTISESDRQVWEIIKKSAKEEDEKKNIEAAKTASEFIKGLKPGDPNHAYLKRKKIDPHTALQNKNQLVIPIYKATGELTGYQTIKESGEKRYLSGMEKQGCCHVIPGEGDLVLICEGFSTGATLHQATGKKVLVALDCKNMIEVARIAIKKYPNIIICADNDHKTIVNDKHVNPGVLAAKAIKDELKIPYLKPERINGSDFNDMATEFDEDLVKDVILESKFLDVYHREKQSKKYPPEVFNPPGILKDVMGYYNESSVKPQPLFAIAAGLILGSVVLGRRYVTCQKNYSSLYFIIAAKSGTGKDHVKQVVREILLKSKLQWIEKGSGYTAANTVIKSLERQPLQLTFFEEIGQRLKEAADNPRALAQGVFRMMLDIWSSCHSAVVGEEYSDGYVPKVVNPALTMAGLTTPRALTRGINESLIEQGFINRILPFLSHAERSPSKLKKKTVKIPSKINKWIDGIWISGNLSEVGVFETPDVEDKVLVPFSDEAIEFLDEIESEILALADDLEKYHLDDMLSRNREIVMRVSLIVAVMDSKDKIGLTHVTWSYTLVKALYSDYIAEIKQNVFGSDYERFKLQALASLRSRGEKGVKSRDMGKLRPWSQWNIKLRSDILDDLKNTGLADSKIEKTGARGPGTEKWYALK